MRASGVLATAGVVAVGLGFIVESAVHASPVPLDIVSVSGQPAPGQPAGVTFAFFDQPRLAAPAFSGLPTLTFWSELAGPGLSAPNNQAIYSDRSGTLAPVYATGATAPWYTVTAFNAFPSLTVDAEGAISILGVVADTGLPPNSSLEAKNGGVFTESSGMLIALAREGEPTPDFPLVNWNNMSAPRIDDAGNVSFWSGSPGIIWLAPSSTPGAIVAPGIALPGLGATESIDAIAPHTHGTGGDIAFHAQIFDESVLHFPVGSGLWIERASGPALLARSGAVLIPGELSCTRPASRAAVNAQGDAAFHSFVQDQGGITRHALVLDIAGTQTVLAVQGDPCPALPGDVAYGMLSTLPAINSCGSIAFHATLTGAATSTSDNGAILRRDAEGTLEAVLREGDELADLPGFVIAGLGDPLLLDSGAAIAMAHVMNPSLTNSGREALLAVTDVGTVRLIAAVGDSIEVSPGDARAIQSILWSTDPIGSGHAQATGDGHFAFVLHLADNTHALMTGYLPPVDDVNADGLVDILDFLDFIDAFSTCELQPAPCPDSTLNVDLDASGTVDILDFLIFIDAFGSEC